MRGFLKLFMLLGLWPRRHLALHLWRHHRLSGRLGGIRNIGDLHLEDKILKRLVTGSRLLVVRQVSGNIQSAFAAFFELPQTIIPSLNDLTRSYDELKRIARSLHVGFEFLAGRQQLTCIPYGYLFP